MECYKNTYLSIIIIIYLIPDDKLLVTTAGDSFNLLETITFYTIGESSFLHHKLNDVISS